MKFTKTKAFIFITCFLIGSMAWANRSGFKSRTELFQQLSDAGIDQVIELPYNPSLIGAIAGQVKIHNILEMQDHPSELPRPSGLMDQYLSSHEYYSDRETIPALTYRTGNGLCSYKEAIKLNDVLVCYVGAVPRSIHIARGPACTTAASRLSHCYVFAHSIDDVVRAISSVE